MSKTDYEPNNNANLFSQPNEESSSYKLNTNNILLQEQTNQIINQINETHGDYISPLHDLLNLDEINCNELNSSSLIDRKNIKWWLQTKLAPLGIILAIERSDSKKIVFRCRHKSKVIDSNKKDEYKSCCFKIRANFSKKQEKWRISIVNDKHNHQLIPNKDFINNDLPIDISHTRLGFDNNSNNNSLSGPIKSEDYNFNPSQNLNYGLIASQLYDENGASATSSVQAAVVAAAVAAEQQLVEENGSLEKILLEKRNHWLRISSEVVLDKLANNNNTGLSDGDKIRILNDICKDLTKILDKEKIGYW